MAEETVETVKTRRTRSDKGKPHGPIRKILPVSPLFTAAPEPPAPINVRIKLKGEADFIEFGAEERAVENGFHVFTYPSERDRYRTTRREFAISEIKEIEITAARGQVRIAPPERIEFKVDENILRRAQNAVDALPRGPQIHSVKKNAASVLGQLEASDGPIKMAALPNMSFGDSAG
jgi:hypothetical protein